MLVTTCSACETDFRVSDQILDKAHGQVRCGRCAHIFDARATLREQEESETRSIFEDGPIRAVPGPGLDPATEAVTAVVLETRMWTDAAIAAKANASGDTGLDARFTDAWDPDEATDQYPVAQAAAGTEPDAADSAPATPDEKEEDPLADTSWLPELRERGPRRRWPYVAAAVALIAALAAQIIDGFRGDLIARPGIGPAVAWVYARFGIDARANVDLAQFELLDLAAVADPITSEQGLLIIETRLRNNGPRVQPVPHIFVALLDRWQDPVAGRYFAPAEYAVGAETDYTAMASDSTIDAQFVIVDPGPGATGFELQICTPLAQGFVCDGDETFK
jgi:predicted Zn finger-like uncharacterized protein